jgi:hypothetical protein
MKERDIKSRSDEKQLALDRCGKRLQYFDFGCFFGLFSDASTDGCQSGTASDSVSTILEGQLSFIMEENELSFVLIPFSIQTSV